MIRNLFKLCVPALLLLSITACVAPRTPQEVTAAFWQAVLDNDPDAVVLYSTLSDQKYYDGFSKDWSGYRPAYGRVTIEQEQASVVTEFAAAPNSRRDDRRFITYLLMRDGTWKVDYERTERSIHGGALGDLLGTIDEMGEELSIQLQSSADAFTREMQRLSEELERLSASLSQQAEKDIEKYADELRDSLKALQRSIERALEREDDKLSDRERRSLQAIADDLEQDRARLADPSVEAVADGSRDVGRVQQRLAAIDSVSLDKYREQWRVLSAKFQAAVNEILDDINRGAGGDDSLQGR